MKTKRGTPNGISTNDLPKPHRDMGFQPIQNNYPNKNQKYQKAITRVYKLNHNAKEGEYES